jgi:hypothetical protein
MRFYRGISVPRQAADAVIAKISSQGLQRGDGHWTMLAPDLKPRLDAIWRMPAISLADTRPNIGNPSWVCACEEKRHSDPHRLRGGQLGSGR